MKIKTSIFIILVVITSCGLFDTREPEEPTGTSSIWTPPANPSDVLQNLVLAFSLRDEYLYMKSFAQPGYADSAFIFQPDYSSPSYDSSLFDDWDYYDEQAFIITLFSPDFIPLDSVCSLEFEAESTTPGESPLYREKYFLTIRHTNSNLPKEYSGRADVRFERNHSGDWVIIRWNDESYGDAPNLTELNSLISN